MKKHFFLFLLIVTAPIYSLQWPIDQPDYYRSFLQGSLLIELYHAEKEATEVYPHEKGEIIFTFEPEHNTNKPLLMRPTIVIENPQNYRSIYQVDRFQPLLENRVFVSEDDILGTIESGPLRFGVIDVKQDSWVNPLLVLPGLEDSVEIEILEVYLLSSDNKTVLQRDNTIPSGTYELWIEAVDRVRRNGEAELLPYKIDFRFLGTTIRSLELNAVEFDDKLQLVGSSLILDEIFSDQEFPAIFLGDITISSGRSEIELTLNDFSGNVSNSTYIVRGY